MLWALWLSALRVMGQQGLCHIPLLCHELCDLREMAEPLCALVRPCNGSGSYTHLWAGVWI